ncbi:uncharacterized protein YndB with AHSA1/START domain [Roseibium hamelinense]|uniref:Uncharacterized protein YndB with AHSA1/START domain n=1 Tax=Roseibium hamelinense TaxID=150831 RepID=A0A562THX8_9HYPH|nr:SRPBCC domain-containing protein [Roseibium hamelinense]MTI45845.1 SRPBCC domain-containing protein [Roseibium hamelinense]TWI92973.1 uncharacterized protein YndB with AHSA1/START domain [Roseibium hamelinense]
MEVLQNAPGSEPVIVEGYFPASPARVFNAWTDPDAVKQWFGRQPNSLSDAIVDLKVGGRWCFLKAEDHGTKILFEGEYKVIEPGHRLVFSWSHVIAYESGKREATPHSLVEVEFRKKGNGCVVKLVHSKIRSDDARKGVGSGWLASFHALHTLLSDTDR